MTVLAFISGAEILFALFIGLLLFGGRLPEIAKDVGKVFFRMRRQLQDVRRDSGIDDVLRDIKREVDEAKPRYPDFSAESLLDSPASGPGAREEPGEASVESPDPADDDESAAESDPSKSG